MIALVTGGSRGIGQAIVKALKDKGHTVAVVGRSQDAPDCDYYIQQDLQYSFDYSSALIIDAVKARFGSIDILINNAGAQEQAKFIEYQELEHDLDLMVRSPFYLSQCAAEFMLRHGGGHIINILSTAAFQGARNISGYVVAKHALLGMTRAMAIELAPLIHVNAVAPGLIKTDMTSNITDERKELLNSITPAGRFGTPAEVADAVMFLLGNAFMYGQVVTVDGGWMAKNG
jgi:NAD(P)-dependent dehydrogenase (short-subunit alcohol dehydrogenase family)